MYPPLFIMEENKNERSIIFEKCDSKLCCELWVVFYLISGVCSVYLLFFIHLASENSLVNISLT